MMYVFAVAILLMMLLCVASAAGLFPSAWSRRVAKHLLERHRGGKEA